MTKPKRNTLKDLLAGSAGGVSSIVVCHPLDTIRLRLQTDNLQRYKGSIDCFRKTVKLEGPKALYSGLAWPLCAQGLYKAVMFGTYSAASGFVHENLPYLEHNSKLTDLGSFMCGAAGGMANGFVLCPIELVRNRLMIQGSLGLEKQAKHRKWYSGPTDVARKVIQTEGGITAMWRGLFPTLVRDFFGVGVYFVTFSRARTEVVRAFPQLDGTVAAALLAGASAGVGYWVVALPIDAIKSVSQTESHKLGKNGITRSIRILEDLYTQGGVRRLYRGFWISAARGIPGAAITFAVQQHVRKYLD